MIDRGVCAGFSLGQGAGGEHAAVGTQNCRADFARRQVALAAVAVGDTGTARRSFEIDDGAALLDPACATGNITFGFRVIEHVRGQKSSSGKKRPAFFGVPVILACVGKFSPFHGVGIERSKSLVHLLANDKIAVGQHDRGGITDKVPTLWVAQPRPDIFHGIVNRPHVREGELVEIVFAAEDRHASVGEHGGSEVERLVALRQAGNLRPRSVDVAACVVRGERVPGRFAVRLREHRTVGQLKHDQGAIGRLMRQPCHCLRAGKPGEGCHTASE